MAKSKARVMMPGDARIEGAGHVCGSSSISVVVPVKNAENTIGRCLEAVFSQSCAPLEVIVVDGYSTDRTVEYASKFPVRIICEDYGTVGGARQVGLQNARGDFVAYTDADCIPERDWLENLVKEFDGNVVGVGGSVKNIGEGIWEKSIASVANTFLGSANSVQGRVFRNKRVVKSISGCNSMFQREILLRIGGFNVSLSVNEETELNRRLSKMGELLYTPNAMIFHNQERGLSGFAKRMYWFGYGRGKLRLWDLQCIPPVVAILLLLSLVFTHWIFISVISLYFFILIIMGIKIAMQERDTRYLGSIPIIYAIEHCSYAIGFWKGLLAMNP